MSGNKKTDGKIIDLESLRIDKEANQPQAATLPSLPLDKISPTVARVTLAIAKAAKCPAWLALPSLLNSITAATMGRYFITEPGYENPLLNYFLTLAMSGEGKGRADKLASKGIARYQSELRKHYLQQLQVFRNDKDGNLERPSFAPVMQKSNTFKGITKSLSINGLVNVNVGDGAAFFQGYSMNKENRYETMANLCELWDSGDFNRTISEECIFLERVALSMHMQLQPEILSDISNFHQYVRQGFFARTLFSMGKDMIGFRSTDKPEQSDLRAIAEHEAVIYDLISGVERDEDSGELIRQELPVTETALQSLNAFFDSIEMQIRPGAKYRHIHPIASRAAQQALRLAGSLAVYDSKTTLDDEAMSWGIAIAQHSLDNALTLSGEQDKSINDKKYEAVKMAFTDKPETEFTREQIRKLRIGAGKTVGAEYVDLIIGQLVDEGYNVCPSKKNNQGKATAWTYNPAGNTY